MDLLLTRRFPRTALVLTAVLAAGLVGAGTSAGAPGSRFDVTAYDIAMSYRPDAGTLRGVTVVSARATDALDAVTLHLSGPTVRSVEVDGAAARSVTRTGEKDLVIVPVRPIRRGARFLVRVEYDGTPGGGWLPTTSGGATAFMGSASAWFPAHEDVHDRANFRLAATVPAGWSVVAIGRERHGAASFRWMEPAVDPAHVAVSIDRFTIERSALADGTPVVNAYAPGLRASTKPLADRLPEILDFLSGTFGRYPHRAAGNVFVHVNDDGPGTAPQTRPVYLGAGNGQYMDLRMVVHEQAHQWYGVSVADDRPRDMCLSECFAVYATWLWDETKDGADLDARYRELVDAHRGDPGFWAALYQPDQAPGWAVYEKGPLALHALRRQVGDKAFHRLVRQWPQRHRGDHAEWPEFETFAEKVTGQDLTGFFQAWFRGETMPGDEYLWPGTLQP